MAQLKVSRSSRRANKAGSILRHRRCSPDVATVGSCRRIYAGPSIRRTNRTMSSIIDRINAVSLSPVDRSIGGRPRRTDAYRTYICNKRHRSAVRRSMHQLRSCRWSIDCLALTPPMMVMMMMTTHARCSALHAYSYIRKHLDCVCRSANEIVGRGDLVMLGEGTSGR
jgi:hypothetical protein